MNKGSKNSRTVTDTRVDQRWIYVGLSMMLATCGLSADGKEAEEAPIKVEERLILTGDDLTELDQHRLVELMGADLPWSRAAAAKVLAERGKTSIPIFKTALTSSDWRVARAGLDGIMTVLANATEQDGAELRTAVVATVPELRNALSNDHYFVRIGALKVLGKIGADAKDAVADVCALFTDKDFMGVAPTAIQTMAAIGIENVDEDVLLEALAKAIRSKDLAVRRAAISVTAKLDEEQQRKLIADMLDALRTPLKDGYTRFHLQARVAKLLYDLGEKEVLPLSIAILAQKGWGHSHRVEQFVPVLQKFGPEAVSALPLLEKFLAREKDPKRRALLEDAIAKIKGEEK